MTTKTLSAVEKLDNAYIEDASETVSDSQQEFVVREFDPKFMKKTMLKVRCVRCPSKNLALTLIAGFDPDASADSKSVSKSTPTSGSLSLTDIQSIFRLR